MLIPREGYNGLAPLDGSMRQTTRTSSLPGTRRACPALRPKPNFALRFAESVVDDQQLERELVRSLVEVFLCLSRFGNLQRLDSAPIPPAHTWDVNFSLTLPPGQSTPSVRFQTQADAESLLKELQMQEPAPPKSQGYSLGTLDANLESDESWKLVPLSDESVLFAVCPQCSINAVISDEI
jgi:hypothetical protein